MRLIVQDDGVSGSVNERTGYCLRKRALGCEGDDAATTLYVDEISRATRVDEEVLHLGNLVKSLGKRMVGVSDGVDSSCELFKMQLHFHAMSNEHWMERHREHVKRGMLGSARRGGAVAAPPAGIIRVVVTGTDGQSVKASADWQDVNRRVLEGYGRWLEERDYAYRSKYLELTILKQALNWLVAEKHISESCRFSLPLAKARGTDTYCYRASEVAAMIHLCSSDPQLKWLGDVITTLAFTGLRISELAQLRWHAIDLDTNILRVVDNTQETSKPSDKGRTSTKTHTSRTIPIHQDLRQVLFGIARSSDGRVFHGPKGGKIKPDVVRTVLIRDVLTPLTKRFQPSNDEMNLLNGRVHSFRHYYCSKCAQDGVPEQTLKA